MYDLAEAASQRVGIGGEYANRAAVASVQHPIEQAISRIEQQTKAVHEMASRLHATADRLYGISPEASGREAPREIYGDSMTGRLLSATDDLSDAIGALSFAAGRNDR